jgi:glutamate/tyrosine decarboxylase-like PLP-dependent enzyme
MKEYDCLTSARNYAMEYLSQLPVKRVFPAREDMEKLEELQVSLPVTATDPAKVLEVLNRVGSVNTVASNGGRYFGFVFGGSLPASLGASWLASAWDQNAIFKTASPIAAKLEQVAGAWLLELLHLPEKSAVGFVTGTTMANFCGLLAARHTIYQRKGWDSKSKGINGAPPIRVIVGEEVHVSMLRALIFAGFGLDNLIRVPADAEGRIIAEQMPPLDDSTLVCLQAGNVNTGAIDPIGTICKMAATTGAWVHVDGAFGLWASVLPDRAERIAGLELADSWAVDLHKWLNVPYDSGLVICKDPKGLRDALWVSAAYLPDSVEAEPYFYTPEMSRRARGIETWAAIYSLGREGVVDMVDRCCRYARLFASHLEKAGFQILNTVSLNQVLVSFGSEELTNRIIKKIQEEGTCWCGGTVWKGITAMRISVSSWMTTDEDIERSAEVIINIAREEKKGNAGQ